MENKMEMTKELINAAQFDIKYYKEKLELAQYKLDMYQKELIVISSMEI